MNDALNNRMRELIGQAQRILAVSHIRPDGDAVGSLLGLGHALQTAGKEVTLALNDGAPVSFRHLPGADQIVRQPKGDYDLVIVLDCSDLLRTGGVLGERAANINIDHHITNLNFAQTNFVITDAVATSAILAEYLQAWGLTINENCAKCLLSGILSDTLGFRTSNVTPHTLRLAADLMERGPNLSDLYVRALVRRPVEAATYWGYGLTKLQRTGRLVWTTLTLADREAAGYPGNDDADLTNVISNLDGTDVSVLLIEQRTGKVKISWRSQPGIDISRLALSFGGGGHAQAAGAEVTGTLEDVQKRVLEATQNLIEMYNGKGDRKGQAAGTRY